MSRCDLTETEWRVLKGLLPIEPENRGRGRPAEQTRTATSSPPIRRIFAARTNAERQQAALREAEKLEACFRRIVNALKECEEREERGDKRRAKMWTIIQLLLDAMEGLDPGHRTLQRAKHLLEEMRLEEATS